MGFKVIRTSGKRKFVQHRKITATYPMECLCLDILGMIDISLGGTAGTIADPKVIFAAAIKSNACGISLAHNHPSGNLNPSQADIDLTKKLKSGGQLLDIGVLDHIILTSEGFYSFTGEGMM